MEAANAKEFMYFVNGISHYGTVYVSKTLDKILEKSDNSLAFVYGVIDTPSGEKLMHMDWSYSNEPILMDVFLHKDYIMNYYEDAEFINL